MRVIALDIGEKRTGVAVSDPGGFVATPLTVLDTGRVVADRRDLDRILTDYEAELVVVGLPLSLDGTEGPQARRVRSLAGKLLSQSEIPLEFVDERLSSAEAKRRMAETGATERDMRGSIDMVAASILLQGYLDGRSKGLASAAEGDS